MESGTLEDLFRDPKHPYLKALLGRGASLRHEAR